LYAFHLSHVCYMPCPFHVQVHYFIKFTRHTHKNYTICSHNIAEGTVYFLMKFPSFSVVLFQRWLRECIPAL
jgi:hypothetical protein